MRKHLQRSVSGYFWQKTGMMMFIFCVFMSGIVKGQGVQFASSEALAQLTSENRELLYYAPTEVDDKNRAALNRIISVELTDVPMEDALRQIAELGELRLAYSTSVGKEYWQRKVSVQYERATVLGVLYAVLEGTDLKLTLSTTSGNGQIVVEKDTDGEIEELIPVPVLQQEVTGRVIDAETGEALPGVNVIAEEGAGDSPTGTTTNMDGEYEIELPDDITTLIFSYIGYQRLEVALDGRTEINVEMSQDIQMMEDVVVVGYGIQEKVTVTGSVSTVSEEEVQAVPTGDAMSRLQGRVAGVRITSSAAPSGGSTVRVRGVGSVGENDPLFVVDGVPVESLAGINPNDIENISVLKDAASSAIYGSRAANGVVLVTTNQGQYGSPLQFEFSARTSIQQPHRFIDVLDSEELGLLKWQRLRNDGLSPGDPGWGDLQYGNGPEPVIPDYTFPAGVFEGDPDVDPSLYNYPDPYYGITRANKEGTNWQREIFSVAPIHEYTMGISGGGDSNRFRVSAGFMDHTGIQNNTGFSRYTLRANSDFTLANWIDIGQNVGVAYTDRRGQAGTGAVSDALRLPPILPIYDIEGNFAGSKSPGTTNATENPVADLYRNRDDFQRQIHLIGNVYSQVNFLENLNLRSMLGINLNNSRIRDIGRRNPEHVSTNLSNSLSETNNSRLRYNWTNTLTYQDTFGDRHNLTALAGSEMVRNEQELINSGVTQFPFEDDTYMVLNAGEGTRTGEGFISEWSLLSFFGRINYNFQEKYMFEAVVRHDGSSRFVGDNRWGTFPAISVGWRVLEDTGSIPFVDDIRLRAGWGQNGNDNVGNYNSFSTFRSDIQETYYNIRGVSNSSEAGFAQDLEGNPNAKWETNTTTNIGLDISALDYAFEFNLDVYKRVTSDMLYPDTKPDTWGQLDFPEINIGEMQNTGFDVMLTYRGSRNNDFSYQISANLSHYKNEVLQLNNNPEEFRYGSSFNRNPYTITKAGAPISSFWGYVVEGFFNTQEDIDNWPAFNPSSDGSDDYTRLGAFKFRDVNGDAIINADDRTIIGNPHPDFTYGINFDVQYRGLDVTMFFEGSQGNDIANFAKQPLLFTRFDGTYRAERLYESWTKERYDAGAKITVPITTNDDGILQQPSTFVVEDGSYIKLKTIMVGYTMPVGFLNLERIRFFLQATNVFQITNYSGLDPELNTDNDMDLGIDNNVYPNSRIFTAGVNINL